MTPQRMHAFPTIEAAAVVGATSLGSVLLELFAPVNQILAFFFGVSIVINFFAGSLKSYAIHRRSGAEGKWFDVYRATFGVAKKVALFLFVALAGIVDGQFMVWEATRSLGDMTPTVKTMLVVLASAQAVGAAQSLVFVIGDDAVPGLAVLLRAIDRSNVNGQLPHRRLGDDLIDAHLPKREP